MLHGQALQPCAPIAQLDRVPDYESVGRRFESYWARQKNREVSGSSVNLFFCPVHGFFFNIAERIVFRNTKGPNRSEALSLPALLCMLLEHCPKCVVIAKRIYEV